MEESFSDSEINKIYSEIEIKWKKNLRKFGVLLPRLKINGKYTKDALVLIFLYKNMGKAISKSRLTSFIKNYYPEVNDVQQARHLGQQKGWFILSGTRGDIEATKYGLKPSEYMFITIETYYPNFTKLRRIYDGKSNLWENIKKKYNYRCATCGSKEGEPNIHYPNTKTRLQKGHKDPTKPLTKNNIIPQCDKCNRADRNNWVYNDKGRVIKLANPMVIKRSNKEIRRKVYEILSEEFS